MSAQIDLDPNLVVVGSDVVPAPTLIALEQIDAYVQAVVVLPAHTGNTLITLLRIYRAPTSAGPWALVDGIPPSPISTLNNLYDINPSIGHANYYCATAVDAAGDESPQSTALAISARAA